MRDPRAGACLPTLQLSDRGTRCGSRWANLLLRSLRAYGRQDTVEGPRLSLQSRSMVGRRWVWSKHGSCARKRAGRKSASPYCFAWQQLACKLLPMPGLRHVLDPRLAGVTDQNEGQSVLVRVAKLINAGTFARFGGRG